MNKNGRTFDQKNQAFVLKKSNKQFVSVLASVFLLLSSSTTPMLKAFADEVTTSEELQPSQQTLPARTSEEPLSISQSSVPDKSFSRETVKTEAVSEVSKETSELTSSEPATVVNEVDVQAQHAIKPQNTDWVLEDRGDYVELTGYIGRSEVITIPSAINNKPVQINLKNVLGSVLTSWTQSFSIEHSRPGIRPVRLTGTFEDLFAYSPIQSADFGDADTSAITNMAGMFSRCRALEQVDVSNFSTQNVTEMQYMFLECEILTTLDLSSFSTVNVTSVEGMFAGAKNLTSVRMDHFSSISDTDTVLMFDNCDKLSTLVLSQAFKAYSSTGLRILPGDEDEGKTTYHWVKDDGMEVYDSTLDFIEADINLPMDDIAHTYTIQKKHEVSFDLDGGSGSMIPQRVFEGKHVTDPAYTGTKEHHTFEGWLLGGLPFSFAKPVTQPFQLKANWRAHAYSIRFNANTGSGLMNDQKLLIDEKQPLASNLFTKQGYHFTNWESDTGEKFTDGQQVMNLRTEDGAVFDLYAQWEANNYTIKFDSNYEGEYPDTQAAKYDKEVSLLPLPEKRPHYTFSGWNTQVNGSGQSFTDSQIVKNLSDEDDGKVILYAQWAAVDYTISFDSNGGSTITDQTYTIERGIDGFETPIKSGYRFLGWYDGDQKVEKIADGESGNRTLKAKWQVIDYTIAFDSNQGKGVMNSFPMVYEQPVELPKNSFTKLGYRFAGWNTDPSGQGSSFGNQEAIKNLTDQDGGTVTLYAQWQAQEYTITFDSAGGNAVADHKYTIESDTFTLPFAVRNGYTFKGWLDDKQHITEIPKSSTGNKQLKADWEAITYQIIFDSDGGSLVPPKTYTIEQEIKSFDTPKKEGHQFEGWFEGDQKVESIGLGQTGDRNFKARWKTNKASLEELIKEEQQKKRQKDDYTPESWKNYEQALENAEKTSADPAAVSDQIKVALESLKNAIANLKQRDKAKIIPININRSHPTNAQKVYPTYTKAKSYPKTGMLVKSGMGIVGIFLISTALIGWRKKRK